jgi:hypothetical protein
VRSDSISTLRVEFTGAPIGLAEVRDWTGRSVLRKPPETDEDQYRIFNFPLAGVGVYEVLISGQHHLSATGPTKVPVNESETFTVSLR